MEGGGDGAEWGRSLAPQPYLAGMDFIPFKRELPADQKIPTDAPAPAAQVMSRCGGGCVLDAPQKGGKPKGEKQQKAAKK